MRFKQNNMRLKIITLIFVILVQFTALGYTSEVQHFPRSEVTGQNALPACNALRSNAGRPYNYRIIDNNIHAGGHPLVALGKYTNSDAQGLKILKYLKSQGVNTVIDLVGTPYIHTRYKKLLNQAGIKEIFVPMHASKVPNALEWQEIKASLKDPVYIHCKHGADRTGSVIAKYLVEEKNYPSYEAWKTVITGGTHAGPYGGLKQTPAYKNLVLFFWPGAKQNQKIKKIYFPK